jgi:predicted nuclease with TOPRIM domain
MLLNISMETIHRTLPTPRLWLLALAGLMLTSCSDTRRLAAELKELKTREVELTTESTRLEAEAFNSQRRLGETERGMRGNEREASLSDTKTFQLKTRLEYLQAATKATSDQSDALNSDTTRYKIKYLNK